MKKLRYAIRDLMETTVRDALAAADISFTEENSEANKGLDFHLTDFGVHIEVKQFHSDRIAEQMSRAPNVIAIQGVIAAQFFAAALRNPAETGE